MDAAHELGMALVLIDPAYTYMVPNFYALINDAFATDEHIRVYAEKEQAESAKADAKSRDAEIISFRTEHARRSDLANGPLYLAISVEDDGLRIQVHSIQ